MKTCRKKDSSHTLILGDDPGFAALQDKIKSYAELGMIFMIFTGVNHASLPDKFWIEFNEALTNPSVSGSACIYCSFAKSNRVTQYTGRGRVPERIFPPHDQADVQGHARDKGGIQADEISQEASEPRGVPGARSGPRSYVRAPAVDRLLVAQVALQAGDCGLGGTGRPSLRG